MYCFRKKVYTMVTYTIYFEKKGIYYFEKGIYYFRIKGIYYFEKRYILL
jgi:hypothetical protein